MRLAFLYSPTVENLASRDRRMTGKSNRLRQMIVASSRLPPISHVARSMMRWMATASDSYSNQ